jgi:hypothetical protein
LRWAKWTPTSIFSIRRTEPAEYRSALTLLGERELRPEALALAQHDKD